MLPLSSRSSARGLRTVPTRRLSSLLACLLLAGGPAACGELPTQSSRDAVRAASPLPGQVTTTEEVTPTALFTTEPLIADDPSTATNCRWALPVLACDYAVIRIAGLPADTKLEVRMTYVADVVYKCVHVKTGRAMSGGTRLDGVETRFTALHEIIEQPAAVSSNLGGAPSLPAGLCRKQEAPGDFLVFPRDAYLQVGYSAAGSFVELDRYQITRPLPSE